MPNDYNLDLEAELFGQLSQNTVCLNNQAIKYQYADSSDFLQSLEQKQFLNFDYSFVNIQQVINQENFNFTPAYTVE
ncbi:hypothetical protein SS50377_24588 [Spironucleus salmonicida]|uniref:Uncharacterized protein n=1 Tax=Spironucleus salmonicida TaxID=348837 RepID=V6LIW9_9EUKA|nr:hypothetical protein SS50377_24588 [Spironucleus salmonicida]|eukprot:EST44555.1 Hypothetical protein SS50377_15557 [Spironucleus salmonicida]